MESENITHRDQYTMLRSEITMYMQQVYQTEVAVAIAVSATYTWLLASKEHSTVAAIVWFVPPAIIIFAGIRLFTLMLEMRRIALYLRKLETVAFGENDTQTPGWERHKVSSPEQKNFDQLHVRLAGALWWIVGATALGFSIYMVS
jgi:hypothetical protein